MYNRFRGYSCMCYNNDNQVLEDVCDNVSSYDMAPDNNCCNCNTDCCQMNQYDCSCGFDTEESVFPSNPMLAQSYVPMQTLDKTFTPCCGLKNGTIFPELVSPYEPCQSMEFINYLKRRNTIGEGCNG